MNTELLRVDFLASADISPQSMTRLKIVRASKFLENTTLPIKQIATYFGYSPSGFARRFVGELTTTPGNWRSEHRKLVKEPLS